MSHGLAIQSREPDCGRVGSADQTRIFDCHGMLSVLVVAVLHGRRCQGGRARCIVRTPSRAGLAAQIGERRAWLLPGNPLAQCRGQGGIVGESLVPLAERQIQRHERRATLVAFGDHLNEQVGLVAILRSPATSFTWVGSCRVLNGCHANSHGTG